MNQNKPESGAPNNDRQKKPGQDQANPKQDADKEQKK
jgi:hypothetical protein